MLPNTSVSIQFPLENINSILRQKKITMSKFEQRAKLSAWKLLHIFGGKKTLNFFVYSINLV